MSDPIDQVTLVDESDQIVGQMDKRAAHRYPLFLHRAVSVWLFRREGSELLLQQRSQDKITGAGWWGNTICGNVWPGESYLECAHRRLREELRIETPVLQPQQLFQYKAYVNGEYGEWEMDQVFVGKYDGDVKPNPEEASDYQWVDWQAFQTQIRHRIQELGGQYPLPVTTLLLSDQELQQQTVPLEIELSGKKLTVVPWTVMMILDGKINL